MASLEPGREGTCLARLVASTSSVAEASTARSPAGGDRAARVERERGVRACGGRASGHGRAMRWRGRCAHSRQLVSTQLGRVIGAPVSRRRQGRGAAHRRRLGRARVPSGVAAAGHVWGHRSALEVFALHLSPEQWRSRLSMKGRSGAGAAGCSGGRRGAAGSGAPALARHCAVPVRRGWETGAGERHGHNQKCRVTKTILLSGVVD